MVGDIMKLAGVEVASGLVTKKHLASTKFPNRLVANGSLRPQKIFPCHRRNVPCWSVCDAIYQWGGFESPYAVL